MDFRNSSAANMDLRKNSDFSMARADISNPFERMPSLYRMPSALQELPCYSDRARSIRASSASPFEMGQVTTKC